MDEQIERLIQAIDHLDTTLSESLIDIDDSIEGISNRLDGLDTINEHLGLISKVLQNKK